MIERCDVWVEDIDSDVDLAVLDAAERSRFDSLRRPEDRARFAHGAALARRVVGSSLGIEAHAVQIDRRCTKCGAPHGKPMLPGTKLHLSVSHSERLVAVALTEAGAVGVDVERIDSDGVSRGNRRVAVLDELVFDESELPVHPADFFRIWCRKEALVKATGDGLRLPLNRVVVSPAHLPARLVNYDGTALRAQLADLQIDPNLGYDYAAAVAVLTSTPVAVRVHQE